MKIAIISTTKNLDISLDGDFMFCLARQAYEDSNYKKFFMNSGKDIYLDNSVHEDEQLSLDDFVDLAIDMKVHSVFIPDTMRDKKQTLEKFYQFKHTYYKLLKEKGITMIGVVQGNTMKEIEDCFCEFNNSKEIDKIAIPFDLIPIHFTNDKYLNNFYNRMHILQFLTSTLSIDKKIHCLGMNTILEMKILMSYPHVESCDSKLITRLSLVGIEITKDNFPYLIKPTRKLDMNEKLNKDQVELCKKNIKKVREIMKTE